MQAPRRARRKGCGQGVAAYNDRHAPSSGGRAAARRCKWCAAGRNGRALARAAPWARAGARAGRRRGGGARVAAVVVPGGLAAGRRLGGIRLAGRAGVAAGGRGGQRRGPPARAASSGGRASRCPFARSHAGPDARRLGMAHRCRAPAGALAAAARRARLLVGRRRGGAADLGALRRRRRHAARAARVADTSGRPAVAAVGRSCARRRGALVAERHAVHRCAGPIRWICGRRPAAGRRAGAAGGRGEGRRRPHGRRACVVQLHRVARPARPAARGGGLHPHRAGGLRPPARPRRQRPPRARARGGGAHAPHDRRDAGAGAAVGAAAGAAAGGSFAAGCLRRRRPRAPGAGAPRSRCTSSRG